MVNCMRRALGLPHEFQRVIPESTISANVCAALTTRESALNWRGTDYGIAGQKQLRVYASLETYSSIDNAVWIAGTVQQYLVKIPTDSSRALDPEALRRAIDIDLAAGFVPAGVHLCLCIACHYNLYVHINAAWPDPG